MWVTKLLSLLPLVCICHGQDMATQVCPADKSQVDVNVGQANVLLGGLFEIRGKGSAGYGCGKPVHGLMQVYEAARYAINILNNNYLPGVKFGMKAFDTCASTGAALNNIQKLFPSSTSSNPFCQSQSTVTPGLIGALTGKQVMAVADMAGRIPASVVSPTAYSPALSDKFKYPTFLRTIPSSALQIKAMVKLLEKLQWQNLVVMYTDSLLSVSLYQEILKATQERGLCVSKAVLVSDKADMEAYKTKLKSLGNLPFTAVVFLGQDSQARTMLQAADQVSSVGSIQWVLSDLDITNDISSIKSARGAMVMLPSSPLMTQFRNYFVGLELNPKNNVGNPWFKEWYEQKYSCSLDSNTCPTQTSNDLTNKFVQSHLAAATIKTIFAYAETVRSVCRNSGAGFCNALKSMSRLDFHTQLKNIDFTFPQSFSIVELRNQRIKFNANGDPEVSEFVVYNYNNRGGAYKFESVGTFISDTITITTTPLVYDSTRTNTITVPTATCANVGCKNCLLPQRQVTFRYMSGDVVLASLVNGHSQGSAAFTCGDGIVSSLTALVASEWAIGEYKAKNPTKFKGVSVGCLMADICPDSSASEAFLTDLLSGNNRLVAPSGQAVFGNNIQAFVDLTTNQQAKSINSILSKYMKPEIQTGASTSMLSSAKQDYFSRAIPNDETFFTAIASLLQKLGWKYIQVATHSSGLYQDQSQIFRRVAARYGVCVTGTEDIAKGDYSTVYGRLKVSTWKTVVVIGSPEDVKGLLDARIQDGEKGVFFISGSETFNRNPELIKVQGKSPNSLIILEPELVSSSSFTSWLTSRTAADIKAHAFLKELYETTNKCSLDPTTRGIYTRACLQGSDSLNSIYQGNTPYMIQSMNLVLEKLNEIITEICGNNYDGLCPAYRSATDIGAKLDAKIKNSGQLTSGFEIKNGEGITNFNIYYQPENIGSVSYSKVAVFDSDKKSLTQVDTSSLGSLLNRPHLCPGVCIQCQYLYKLQDYSHFVPGDFIIGGAFSVSNAGPADMRPYICGDIRQTNGPQFTTAMMYAIDQVNKGKAPVSVKGLTIGGLALDHCDNKGRVNLMLSDIYSTFNNFEHQMDSSQILSWMIDSSGPSEEAATLLDPLNVAMVSPSATAVGLKNYDAFYRTIQGDGTAAAAIVKIVKFLGFPYVQVVYSATAFGRGGLKTLTAVAEQENICITNSAEIDSVAKIPDVLQILKNTPTSVIILYTGTSDTKAVLDATVNDAEAKDKFLFLITEPYNSLIDEYQSRLKQPIVTLQLQTSILANYAAYLGTSPIDNPYFARYYMSIKKCNLPGYSLYSNACVKNPNLAAITSDSSYTPDNYNEATINAVYASVDALHRTIKEYCGNYYTEPCAAFRDAPNWRQRYNALINEAQFVSDARTQFRFLDREGNTAYNILLNNQKVGSYGGVTLDIEENKINVDKQLSQCTAPCLQCVIRQLDFSFTPGDVYLAGMFDVHSASLNPFTCGKIKTLHGFLLLEAFHYAIKQVNEKKGMFANILPGTKLGGIGLDECASQVRSGYIVSNINNGLFSLAREGIFIKPDEIDAYIGAYDSGASMYMARILTDLKIPQITYASSSMLLQDEIKFPYFYRTVPNDESELTAILAFLDKMDIRYVQVLYKDNMNGISVWETLQKLLGKHRICVAQAVPYPPMGLPSDEISNFVVQKITEKPTANTIISFLDTEYMNSVLKAVKRNEAYKDLIQSKGAEAKLRFFGWSAWADNQDAIEDAEDVAVDSLTIKIDSDDVEDFERYLSTRTLADSYENPWFEEYYQEIYQCYTSMSDKRGYSRQCSKSPQKIISSPGYSQDPGVVNVMNSVYAAALALDETLKKYCGPNYAAVCQAYRNNVLRRLDLSEKLADVSFTDAVGRPFYFKDRTGPSSYRFNTIVKGIFDGAVYKQIANYNVTTGEVFVSPEYKPTLNSGCDGRKDVCAECPTIRNAGLRYFFVDSQLNVPKDAMTVVVFFDIHKPGADLYRCGELNMPGFQQFLAFMHSKDLFRNKIMGSLTDTATNVQTNGIRFLVIDTCSNPLRVDQDLFGLLRGDGLCNTKFDKDNFKISIENLGAVMTAGDANTLAAARVLEPMGVTYISPSAITPALDDKPNLARTISPTSGLMEAVVALVNKLGWTYVDVIYEEDIQAALAAEVFDKLRLNNKVCVGSSGRSKQDSNDAEVQDVLSLLSGAKGSKVVVLFGRASYVHKVIQSAVDMQIGADYIWLVTTQLDYTKFKLPAKYDLKILSVTRITDSVESFDQTFVSNIKYDGQGKEKNAHQIPQEWFEEFFQEVHGCQLKDAKRPLNKGKPECDVSKTIDMAKFKQDPYVLNTIAATFAVTHGLSQSVGTCKTSTCHAELVNKRADIKKEIFGSTRQFSGVPGSVPMLQKDDLSLDFKLNAQRWWDTGVNVVMWSSKSGETEVWKGVIPTEGEWSPKMGMKIESKCSPPGECGCTFTEFLAQKASAPKPTQKVRNYFYYDEDEVPADKVYDWPIWAIAVAVPTCLGFLICLILFLILICAYPKRGGTSVLGYMAVFGILLIYAINVAFFFPASDAICGIRRFLMATVYMITFAPLLIKAIDNWRFGQSDFAGERYSGISSACCLFMSALGLVLVQCIIPIMWLILVHPTATDRGFPGAHHDNMWCDPYDDYDLGLVLSHTFVVFIIGIVSIFAALGYDTDRNSYESRWILFACVATAGCMMVWMVVSTNANPEFRDPAVAIANLVNATLLLLILPFRKTVLMCKALQEEKEEKMMTNGTPYDNYNPYVNTAYELDDYDPAYVEG